MNTQTARCLILACGNTLREDDGIGPFLAAWAEKRFADTAGVRVIAAQQWTPEFSAEIAAAETVLFLDCSVNTAPGSITVSPVLADDKPPRLMTHHLDATSLLALAHEYYDARPRQANIFTIGAGSLELREGFSDIMQAAIPEAQQTLEEAVLRLLGKTDQRK
ncbi:MAG: hydrogenase maturation protease [Acidobacteriaceae bacterium]|nr:hydrogenase maturation protease [Acidobacteriaceae bacterium]